MPNEAQYDDDRAYRGHELPAMDSPVQPQALVDQLVRRLEGAIITGQIGPGERIREAPLALTWKVSRGPLREAIRRLEGQKLLIRTPNHGSRVATLSHDGLRDALALRERLEGLAAALAAQRIDPNGLASLHAAMDRHRRARQEGTLLEAYRGASTDFHGLIANAAGSERLRDLLQGDLFYLMRRYRYRATMSAGRAEDGRHEHEAIVKALQAGDADQAETLMRAHLRKSHSIILQQAVEDG